MGIIGCYTLTLYCDAPACGEPTTHMPKNADFVGKNYRDAAGEARKQGWVIRRVRRPITTLGSGHVICPDCAGKRKV